MTLYKIGDICELLNITPRTIRYYDQLGLLPNIKRSDGDTRLFDQHDIDTIKSVRLLQKTKELPLNTIKDELFPKNLSSKNIILLTDSFSQHHLPLSAKLTVIPINDADSITNKSKQIYQFIQSNITDSSIIICFFHESLSPAYASLSKQFLDQTYFLYPLKHYGMTNYMITHYIYNNLDSFSNLEELHLVINRLITLGFSLCLLDSLDTFLSVKKEFSFPHNFLLPITAYSPILLSNNTAQSVVSFKSDIANSIDDIVLTVDACLHQQKRYMQDACIFYSHTNTLALAIQKALTTYCPNVSCSISKINNWSSTKNQVHFISII